MPRHDGFGSAASHDVDARLPADPGFVAALRALATALAARCDWTVDDIEDLQIGVDEACALVLPHARQPGGQLSVHLQVMPASADIVVSVPADASVVPDRSGFSWTVLSAVTDHMHMTSGAGSLAIRFCQQCTSRVAAIAVQRSRDNQREAAGPGAARHRPEHAPGGHRPGGRHRPAQGDRPLRPRPGPGVL